MDKNTILNLSILTTSSSEAGHAQAAPSLRSAAPLHTSRPALVQKTPQARRGVAWIALVFFLVVSTGITWYGRNQRSGRNRETFPGDAIYHTHPILGQCDLQGQDPFWYEDIPVVEQVAFFSGWRDAQLDYLCLRPLTAFFATLFTPAVGTIRAALLVNWLSWVVCAWAAWRLCIRVFHDDLAALLAVIFVSGAIAMVYHIGDYSAHIPAFAGYYLVVDLLFESGIPFKRKPWQTHLLMGALLALICLLYSWYGTLLLAVYILSASRHNCWYHMAGAVALTLSAPLLWKATLRLIGIEITSQEEGMLTGSLSTWWGIFRQPSLEAVGALAGRLRVIGIFDSPLVIVLGVLSCLLLPRNGALRWFGFLVMGIPLLATFAVLCNTDMRGYLIYGASIWIYCCLGRLLAIGLCGRPWVRVAAGLVLFVAVSTHFAWSTAHFWGWLGPVKSFIEGWDIARPYFMHPRPTVLSMTGLERTPVLFGGDASLGDAGAYVTDPQIVIEPASISWRRAFAAQALFWGYLAIVGIAVVRSLRRRLVVVAVALCLSVVSPSLSCLTFRAKPNYIDTRWGTSFLLPPGAKFSYRVELSQAFLDILSKEMRPQDQLHFFIGLPNVDDTGRSSVEVSVTAGPVSIPVQHKGWKPRLNPYANPSWRDWDAACWAVDPQAAVTALHEAGQGTVEVTNHLEEAVGLPGWQRSALPGRRVRITLAGGADADAPEILPPVEIRLVRPDGSIKVAGF